MDFTIWDTATFGEENMQTKKLILVLILMMTAAGCSAFTAAESDIERISTQKLNVMLGQQDVIVVDVRSGRDWANSGLKIRSAVREELSKIEGWMGAYPKDKILVFYCA